ncbi:MAG: rRNA pseudouridine synthase [Oscillospiraceae bacterium]|nr:rRNA pseudouridine synthase [Oscillospiraceae bacterium]
MRLDRFICSQGGLTRSDAKRMIQKGFVSVNGKVAVRSDTAVDEEKDVITLKGQVLSYRKYVYIMLNKPKGYICATEDRKSATVTELIPPSLFRKGIFPAGRLDIDTTGFVLMTDDGELAHNMLSPKHHVEKEYEVSLRDPCKEDTARLFEEGITLEDGESCAPARLIFTGDPKLVRLVLHEGKFHQVKRMFEAAGNKVTDLKRIRIGGVCLDESLAAAECRELNEEEVGLLLKREKTEVRECDEV